MLRLLVLVCCSALLPSLANGTPFSENNPPDCDTLITASGKTYLILVGWEGEREIQYRLCDDQSGRVYGIQRDSIRELKRQKGPAILEKTPSPSAPTPQRYSPSRDTFDLLTLTNGKTYRVIILVRDYLNTYYQLYDDPLDDREYCVPNRDVRSVRVAKSHRTIAKKKTPGCLVALSILLALLLLLILGSIGG